MLCYTIMVLPIMLCMGHSVGEISFLFVVVYSPAVSRHGLPGVYHKREKANKEYGMKKLI